MTIALEASDVHQLEQGVLGKPPGARWLNGSIDILQTVGVQYGDSNGGANELPEQAVPSRLRRWCNAISALA